MTTHTSLFPNHRHSAVAYIDLRRSLPSLHGSLSPSAPVLPHADAADRLAQLKDAEEAARGMRRLFLIAVLFWAALIAWYLYA